MSRATLTLRKAIWNQEARVSAINKGLDITAETLEHRLKSNIDENQPSGSTRRIGSLTAPRTRANAGFNARRGRSSGVTVGSIIHRQSARGEPPAKLTKALYKSLKVRRQGSRSVRATVGTKYSRRLDDPLRLNRPHFKEPIRKFHKEEFLPIMKAQIKKLT